MYKEFITQLCIYNSCYDFGKRVPAHFTYYSIKIKKKCLHVVRMTVRKTSPDYNIVIKRLYLYYDMKLVTLGIDKKPDNPVPNIHTAIYTATTCTLSD